MHLTRLALTDFRSYESADVTLEAGVSTFTGANGQGKTNLIEAVGYAATLGSHRVATDAPLIRRGAQRAIVRAAVSSAARDSLVEIEVNPGRANRVRLNRAPVRPRQVLGTLRSVLFAPEDLAVVKGDPDQRRRYLDDLLVATRPRYAGVRADYERVVRQRTALLRSGRAGGSLPPGALEVWDEHLVAAGSELTAGRIELVTAIRPLVAEAYAAVSGEPQSAGLRYRQPVAGQEAEPPADAGLLADGLRAALAQLRRAELDRAVCLAGPHRDELELTIGGLPARGYASHGESWSMALALRLASFALLRDRREDPVLILDDVFAELDAGRRDQIGRASCRERV